jgi:hypothetical protein
MDNDIAGGIFRGFGLAGFVEQDEALQQGYAGRRCKVDERIGIAGG